MKKIREKIHSEKINISVGNTGGYYGNSPNIHIYDDDGTIVYEFSEPGWDFDTESQFVAAALIKGSKFKNEPAWKDVKFVRPSESDWENATYWITGGNTEWHFHDGMFGVNRWEDYKRDLTEIVKRNLEKYIPSCRTLADLIKIIEKEQGNIYEEIVDDIPELTDDDEEDW